MRNPLGAIALLRRSAVVQRHVDVERLRRLIFGFKSDNPSEVDLTKCLTADKRMNYYPPSVYSHPNFRVDQYLMMQAQRFAPKEADPTMQHLVNVITRCRHNKEELEKLFAEVTEDEMKQHPTLRDVQQLLEMVNSAAIEQMGSNSLPDSYPSVRYGDDEMFVDQPIPDYVSASSISASSELPTPKPAPSYVPVCGSIDKSLERSFGRSKFQRERHADHHRSKMNSLLAQHEALKETAQIRNRFISPIYMKRRVFYLEHRAQRAKGATKLRMQHFLIHPDQYKQFPTHKGPTMLRYPAVHC